MLKLQTFQTRWTSNAFLTKEASLCYLIMQECHQRSIKNSITSMVVKYNPKKCFKIEHIEGAILFPFILISIPKSSIASDESQRLTITKYAIYRMKTHRRSDMAYHHCTCIEHISILNYIHIISFNIYLLQRANLRSNSSAIKS